MKIGILGAGNVGGSLGKAWAQCGHEIVFGARDPHGERAQQAVAGAGSNARARRWQQRMWWCWRSPGRPCRTHCGRRAT